MKTYPILLPLILILVCISCKNEGEQKFIREWQSKKAIIPHMDNLKIKPDHTFEFFGGACMDNYNSAGNWKVVNDTLILNSIPSKDCQILVGFGNNMENPSKKDFVRKTTIKGCKPEEQNGEYINFINEKFYIKKDTLEYVTNIKFPFNDRIAFFIKR